MKRILFTQRVSIVESYGERRDCADQNLCRFLAACGFLPIPLPNFPDTVIPMVEAISPKGIFLTGGNDLERYGGDSPERDETERRLLSTAIKRNLPVFGICRGMQMMADYFGSKLVPVSNHVRTRHPVEGEISRSSVNSYHGWKISHAEKPLRVWAKAPDGCIEGICHSTLRIAGIGWHPEREKEFSSEDIHLIKTFYGGEV